MATIPSPSFVIKSLLSVKAMMAVQFVHEYLKTM